MSTLILKTRLHILRRNLEEVETVLKTVNKHRGGMNALLELPAYIEALRGQLDLDLHEARMALRSHNDAIMTSALDDMASRLDDVWTQTADAKKVVDGIGMRPASPREIEELEAALTNGLAFHATKRIGKVKAIEDSIPIGKPAADGKLKKAWKAYGAEVGESHRVFAEYFDFLGGLALRDSGFDQGICSTADELIGKIKQGVGWLLPTLPARQVALDRTLARIIRMGFPEWTLWALPLTAHEVGHVVLREDEEEPELTRLVKRAQTDPDLQIYLADAFATYVMGPAYACAEILMSLGMAADDMVRAGKRAQVMLETLNYMNGEADGAKTAFTPIISQLEREWNDALAISGRTPVLENPATVKSWVKTVAKARGRTASFPADDWATIERWSAQLASGSGSEIELRSFGQLRYLLNAAWHCRATTNTDPGTIIEQLDKPWREVLGQSGRAGTGTPPTTGSSRGGSSSTEKGSETK